MSLAVWGPRRFKQPFLSLGTASPLWLFACAVGLTGAALFANAIPLRGWGLLAVCLS